MESLLPPLYARWIGQLLLTPIPEESKATCSDCPMCRSQELPAEQRVTFNVDTKCCTYHPEIPNFLAGAILMDSESSSAEGRNRFRARLEGAAVLHPQGVFPSLAESAKYAALNPGFGTDLEMLCPYYIAEQGGLCGIWQHRNSRCATWFCKHERGSAGREFWRTLKELLGAVEQYVSLWCIHLLQAGTVEFRELFSLNIAPDLQTFQRRQNFLHRSALPAEYIDGAEASDLKQKMWGQWIDRKESFYRECALAVQKIDWPKLVSFADPTLLRHASRLQESFARLLSPDLPEVLIPGAFQSIAMKNTLVRVWGYSQYDPVDVPSSALTALAYFDGRSTEDVLAWIQANTDIPLTRTLVRKLHDFGLLNHEDAK